VRIAGTFLASLVFAFIAGFVSMGVCSVAKMAATTDTLADWATYLVLSGRFGREHQAALVAILLRLDRRSGLCFLCTALFLLLGLPCWESWAGLAALVAAIRASLVSTVGILAFVAVAMNAHANVLVDTILWWRRG
jgi:hypothetical protein